MQGKKLGGSLNLTWIAKQNERDWCSRSPKVGLSGFDDAHIEFIETFYFDSDAEKPLLDFDRHGRTELFMRRYDAEKIRDQLDRAIFSEAYDVYMTIEHLDTEYGLTALISRNLVTSQYADLTYNELWKRLQHLKQDRWKNKTKIGKGSRRKKLATG